MATRYLVTFSVALLVMGSAHYFIWARLVRDVAWGRAGRRIGTAVVALLFVVLMGSFPAIRALPRSMTAPLSWVAFTWLGLLFFLVLALAMSELAKRLAKPLLARSSGPGTPTDPDRRVAISRLFGGLAAVASVGAGGVAAASALGPVGVARVRVAIDRLTKSRSGYRIVQISDVHIGPTIGRGFLEDVVAKINALEPDLVAITGDLVDGSVEDLRAHIAPLAKIAAKDGVFFVTGNHEYYSGADSWIAHLHELGIRVLRNQHVRIGGEDGIDIAGIDDASSRGLLPGHGPDLRKALEGRDPSRPLVLLAHQPKGIHLADELGVDLQLSGHTHGGQLFPWNFLVRLQQPFVAGLHRLTNAQIYVSRGTGYWGPPMRLGAPAEITEIVLVSNA